MTKYNLPSERAAPGTKGRRRRSGPRGRELLPSPTRHPERPEPPRSRPELTALPRRRPQPPALPDPPRTRFLQSRTPALASPREKAGQFGPLLGRGDSRGDVNTASPAARGPSPAPGSVTSSLRPAPRPALPAGRRAARLPLSPSPAPRPLPEGAGPLPPRPAGVTATASGKPLREPRRKQHRRGEGTRREAAALGTARLPRRALRAPSHGPGSPRSYLLSASPEKTAASLSLPAGPRTRRRRGRRWPGVQREPGPPGSPSRSAGRGGDKTARAAPRSAPPPAPPHRPPTAEATAATQSPARGAMVAPALGPLPSLQPPVGSSPSASSRRHQDT